MKISVIGLGKLGLCTAACFAVKGHSVIGIDKNDYIMNELMNKRCPIDETGLTEFLGNAWSNFTVTSDLRKVIMESDITLIITPTPSDENGRFSNRYIETVLREICPLIKEKDSFHIVDVVSTVMPGSSENEFKPLMEELTGKECGKDFGLVYNPEFIALGSVIKNFLNPDMILIGASDDYSGNRVKELYESTCDNNPIYNHMNLTSAEITKISLNCYVTMKISFVNELASICENVESADIDSITSALGTDSRIGNKYMKAGLGFGGPCFPRDNQAFQVFARDCEGKARLGEKVVEINNEVVERLYKHIAKKLIKGSKVALLGLSYKPDTHIVEASQSIILAKRLKENEYNVRLHDPKALDEAKKQLGNGYFYFDNMYDCIKGADCIVILTNWKEYGEIDWNRARELCAKNTKIIDSWRLFMGNADNYFDYVYVGKR